MSTHKTFFGKIFGWIGDIFKNSVEKIWESLSPEEQTSLKHGSGVIAIINAHISDAPEAIQDAIVKEFPDLDIPTLEKQLVSVCQFIGINLSAQTITDAINALKVYLSARTGKAWEWASSALAEALSIALAPDETIFEKISMLIQYVYSTFIKK